MVRPQTKFWWSLSTGANFPPSWWGAILSRTDSNIGLGFAIPSSFAHGITLDLIREGWVRRGFLGVSIEDLNAEYAEAFQVPEAQGAFVQSVGEGLPAEVAGLRGGDVIVAVDGREVRGARDFRMKIAEFAPGETVALSVRREGDLLQMKVKLADPEQPYSYNSHSHGLTWMLLLRHHQPFHASAPSTHPS